MKRKISEDSGKFELDTICLNMAHITELSKSRCVFYINMHLLKTSPLELETHVTLQDVCVNYFHRCSLIQILFNSKHFLKLFNSVINIHKNKNVFLVRENAGNSKNQSILTRQILVVEKILFYCFTC